MKTENMKSLYFFCIISLFPCFLIPLFAQQKAVQYTKDFEFSNGIYLSFNNFKNNNPIIAAKILSDYNKTDRDFFDKILSKSNFSYIDSSGKEQIGKCNDIWGYCQNGIVYINHGTDYNRLTIIGSICHFVATTPMKVGISDPFSYNDPYYAQQQYTYTSQQFVLDFETGKILEFNVSNMEPLLSRDVELYSQFSSLKKKQKRDSIFLYLRKYNEKHSVYFPE